MPTTCEKNCSAADIDSDQVAVGLAVRAGLIVQRSDGDSTRAVNEPILSHHRVGLGLIQARSIAGSRDRRRVGCVLQGAVYAVPSSYIHPQAKNGDETGCHEGKDKGDRSAFI